MPFIPFYERFRGHSEDIDAQQLIIAQAANDADQESTFEFKDNLSQKNAERIHYYFAGILWNFWSQNQAKQHCRIVSCQLKTNSEGRSEMTKTKLLQFWFCFIISLGDAGEKKLYNFNTW